jgi:DNA-binding CsgD family transcriptional regulator
MVFSHRAFAGIASQRFELVVWSEVTFEVSFGRRSPISVVENMDRAIANLSAAPLVQGGWKLALRDIAATVGSNGLVCLQIADASADHFEHFSHCLTPNGDDLPLDHTVLPKSGIWNQKFSRIDRSRVLSASSGSDDIIPSLCLCDRTARYIQNANDYFAVLVSLGSVRAMITVFAAVDDQPFEQSNLAALKKLVTHIERAALAHSAIGAIRANLSVSSSLLDQLPFGVVMIDSDGRVIDRNVTGERLVDDHAMLSIQNGLLCCTDPDEDQILQAALSRALVGILSKDGKRPARSGAEALKLYGSDGMKPWSLTVSPVSGAENELAWGRNRPRGVVCVSDRQPITQLRAGQVSAVFGLSPQEEMITARLAAGDTLNAIAESTNRSVETLRTQLRAVFQKTEVATQSQLVQLVLCAPMGI